MFCYFGDKFIKVWRLKLLFLILQDHCLADLLHGWQDRRLPVDITCVIRWSSRKFHFLSVISFHFISACYRLNIYDSNHDRGPNTHVIRFLERHGIPYHYLCTTKENKSEEEMLQLVQNTDFLVLARYMQVNPNKFSKLPTVFYACFILSKKFCWLMV